MKQWKQWLIVFCVGIALGLLIDYAKEARERAAYREQVCEEMATFINMINGAGGR